MHAAYYLELAEEAEAQVGSALQGGWFDRLDREHDNIRAALQWAVEHEDAEVALRLGSALARFWYVRGYYSEGRSLLASVLLLSGNNPGQSPAVKEFRAKALGGRATSTERREISLRQARHTRRAWLYLRRSETADR